MAKFGFRRPIKGTQSRERVLRFIVDGTGTASITLNSTDATLVDNGTGDYTLTFNEAFVRSGIAHVTPITADVVPRIVAQTITTIQINTDTNAGAPVDADFHLTVVGYDSSDAV